MLEEVLARAKTCLQVHDVFVSSCSSRISKDWLPGLVELELQTQHRFGLARFRIHPAAGDDQPPAIVEFVISCGLRYMQVDAPEDVLAMQDPGDEKKAEVTAEFSALYVMKEVLTEKELDIFGRANVGYHVWPYWRELLASQCTRMHMPPITLPMYQMPDLAELEEASK